MVIADCLETIVANSDLIVEANRTAGSDVMFVGNLSVSGIPERQVPRNACTIPEAKHSMNCDVHAAFDSEVLRLCLRLSYLKTQWFIIFPIKI